MLSSSFPTFSQVPYSLDKQGPNIEILRRHIGLIEVPGNEDQPSPARKMAKYQKKLQRLQD